MLTCKKGAWFVALLFIVLLSITPPAQAAYVIDSLPFENLFAEDAGFGLALSVMEVFFGIVMVMAVLVTGFFLGRRWLRSVG